MMQSLGSLMFLMNSTNAMEFFMVFSYVFKTGSNSPCNKFPILHVYPVLKQLTAGLSLHPVLYTFLSP